MSNKWDPRAHFLGASTLIAATVTALIVWWHSTTPGKHYVITLLASNRTAIYTVLATLWGTLLGFVITAVSIVMVSAPDPRLAVVRASPSYPYLWKTFLASMRWLGLATVGSFAGLVFDRDSPGTSHVWVFFGVVFLSQVALYRVAFSVWVFHWVVKLLAMQSKERDGNEA